MNHWFTKNIQRKKKLRVLATFGKYPKGIGDLFSNAYRVMGTLLEMPK
jgi:hypothetical protein